MKTKLIILFIIAPFIAQAEGRKTLDHLNLWDTTPAGKANTTTTFDKNDRRDLHWEHTLYMNDRVTK